MIRSRSLACLSLAAVAALARPSGDRPSGHPFGSDMGKLSVVVNYLNVTNSWGLPDPFALQIAANALGVVIGPPWRLWRPSDGLGPIFARIP